MESNARLVRWSDGSVQLFIGANEVMNVTVQNISKVLAYSSWRLFGVR
jgi:hypothetical protein